MSKPNDGGPAFPLFLPPDQTGGNIYPIEFGMSLRDWFAGQALIGVLRDPSATSRKCAEFALEDLNAGRAAQSSFMDIVARSCYAYADALIAERAK